MSTRSAGDPEKGRARSAGSGRRPRPALAKRKGRKEGGYAGRAGRRSPVARAGKKEKLKEPSPALVDASSGNDAAELGVAFTFAPGGEIPFEDDP